MATNEFLRLADGHFYCPLPEPLYSSPIRAGIFQETQSAWSLTSLSGLTLTSITHFSHFSGWGLSSISLFHRPPPLFLRKSVISPSLLPASPKPYWTRVSVRRSSAASAALSPRLAGRGSVPRPCFHPYPACLRFSMNFTPAERGRAGERGLLLEVRAQLGLCLLRIMILTPLLRCWSMTMMTKELLKKRK